MKQIYYTLGSILLGVAGLIFFKGFLVPVALGLFIATILLYLSRKYRLSKGLVLGLYGLCLLMILGLIWWGGSSLYDAISTVVTTTELSINSLLQMIQDRTSIDLPFTTSILSRQIRALATGISYSGLGASVGGVVLDSMLVIVYSILFVVYEHIVIKSLDAVTKNGKLLRALATKKNAQYIGSLFTIAGILAILYAIVLYGVGVQYAWVIALAAAACTLVPTVGTAIGVIVASITTYALTNSLTLALIVLGILGVIQLLEEYIILPVVAGRKLTINPLATILFIVLGGVIWGIAGVFLALPFVSIIQVLIKQHHPHHRFVVFTKHHHE